MQAREWTFIDKTKWPERGEWDQEPDKAQWTDAETGLPCLAVRNRAHWCGYVGVTEDHPAFKKDGETLDVDVHGGLTFSGMCQPGEGDARICHVPDPGESEYVWWLGFDCAHWGDYRPAELPEILEINRRFSLFGNFQEHYRNLAYVKSECASLAQQLHQMTEA